MNLLQPSLPVKRAIAVWIIGLLILPIGVNGMLAVRTGANQTRSAIRFTPPPPPPDRNAPGNRGGGAGRSCGVRQQSITALVPEYQQSLTTGGMITKVWGMTTAERPTFWFDVPYPTETIVAMEFVLQTNANPAQDLYRTAITPPASPGIVRVQLPLTVPPLEVGQGYQWFFKVRLRCGSGSSVAPSQLSKETVSGWVERVSPSAALLSQLKEATPSQRAALYAQQGIWFDALTALVELRLSDPQNIALLEEWSRFLQTVGLEKLAAKPIISHSP